MSTKDEIFLPDVGWLHEADFLELVELAYEPVKQNIVSEAEYQDRLMKQSKAITVPAKASF